MLVDRVLDTLGGVPALQADYLLYHRVLQAIRRQEPLTSAFLQHALGWSPAQFKQSWRLLQALGLVRATPRVSVTVVGDPFIEGALGAAATLSFLEGQWRSPKGVVDHATWAAARAKGTGQFPDQPFGYSPTLTEAEAWAALEPARAYWKAQGLEFPAAKRPARYTPATDELREAVEAVQHYANRAFGKHYQLLDPQGKEVGRGSSGLGRYGVIRRALAEWQYTPEQLCTVIDRAAGDEWWKERGLLDTLRIFRKPEHIERWLGVVGGNTLLSVGQETEAEAF